MIKLYKILSGLKTWLFEVIMWIGHVIVVFFQLPQVKVLIIPGFMLLMLYLILLDEDK